MNLDLSNLPAPGRVIRNSDGSYPFNYHTHLSIQQALKNQQKTKNTDFFWTADINTELPIRLSDVGVASYPPVTIVEIFADIVCRCSSLPALGYEEGRKWQYLTWEAYWTEICRFAKSLVALGFKDRDRVCIMGSNAPAWFISYFGAIFCNGVAAGIYTTNGYEATKYVMEHAECVVAVVDTRANLEKAIRVRQATGGKYPRSIVIYMEDPPDGYQAHGVMKWEKFLVVGTNVPDVQLTQRMEAQRPGNCCTVVYTSGTTGPPKGVLLTHDNVCWTAWATTNLTPFDTEDRFVSYLPLSHIASQYMDMFVPLFCGGCVYFAKPDALQGTLLETLKQVRPTWFFSVPRVWEKFEEKIKEVGAQRSGLTKAIGDWAKRVGFSGTYATVVTGKSVPFGYALARKLILGKIQQALGLDQAKAFGSGAAPINSSTQEYFMSLGMPICDCFGLSETTGPQIISVPIPGWYRAGSIGRALPGTEIMVSNPNEDGVGEMCFRGRNVFVGYFKNAEESRAVFDDNGFLHSGDIGYIDDQGFAFITGRIKELLITAGGENVAPVLIERVVMEEMPFISNCQVVGDRRRFLSLLICLRSVLDSNNQPTNNLAESTIKMLAPRGSKCRTTFEAANDPVMAQLIHEGIQRSNQRATSKAQHIRKWRIVPQDFTREGGELTATMKLMRKVVIDKYKDIIEDMYAEYVSKL